MDNLFGFEEPDSKKKSLAANHDPVSLMEEAELKVPISPSVRKALNVLYDRCGRAKSFTREEIEAISNVSGPWLTTAIELAVEMEWAIEMTDGTYKTKLKLR